MIELHPADWTLGWRENGEFFQPDVEPGVNDNITRFCQLIDAAGFTISSMHGDHHSPRADLWWQWGPDETILRWIPRTEAAALWLRLNAPELKEGSSA